MTKVSTSFSINSPEIYRETLEQPSQTIERMLSENIQGLKLKKAIVESLLDKQFSSFRCSLITEATPETLQTNPDILTANIPSTILLPLISFNKTVFSIDCLPGQSYVLLDFHAAVDSPHTFAYLSAKKKQLEETFLLWAQFPSHYQQLIHSPGLESPTLLAKLCEGFLKWAKYLNKQHLPKDFFEEAHRFFLANDADFKQLRTSNHLARLLRSHYVLRKRLSHSITMRRLHVRILPSRIQFPFGRKNVISIVVCLKKLYKNEQFDHRHIIQACKRCLPSLVGVLRSYYSYRYPKDTSIAYHIECEKANGAPLSLSELTSLRNDLPGELLSSIERVMSHIDIPCNDEEMLRNMIFLLHQINTQKDLPHLLLQFQEQSATSLTFHASIARPIKATDEELSSPPAISSPSCNSTLLKSYTVETFKKGYHKQGLTFSIQCTKETFLRKDRSVDFHKARETVLQCIETVFGPVRDLNGGLLTHQHRILEGIKSALSEKELKYASVAEDLFRSVVPGIMKNFLHIDHLLKIFRLYLSMKGKGLSTPEELAIESNSKALYIGFIRPPNVTKEEIGMLKEAIQAPENSLAIFHTSEEQQLCFILCISRLEATREACVQFLRKLLKEKQESSTDLQLRLCLPYLTNLLDPRIVSDKTSGAVISMLYEGLMRRDSNGTPQPAIARDVSISNNGLTYTFTLKNTYWSNGQPVTAHDFMYAWKKMLDPSLQTHFAFLLYPIRNARAIKQGAVPMDLLGVHALADQTLEIHLEKPTPNFLERVCLWVYSPLLQDIDIKKPGWAFCHDKTYVCNGPFMIKKQKTDGRLRLAKNELYWDKASIELNGIDISVVENSDQALCLFKHHHIDMIGEPFFEVPLQAVQGKSAHLRSIDGYGMYFLQLNMQTKLLQSLKIRQALSLAIDRKKIVDSILQGHGRPSSSIIHSHLFAPQLAFEMPHDITYAQKLFEEGLRDLNMTKLPKKALTLYVSEKEAETKLTQAVADMWKEAFGLKIVMYPSPEGDACDGPENRSYDIWATHWLPWLQDPLYTIEALCDPTNPYNYGNWDHQGCQCIIKQAQSTLGIEYRNLLIHEAEKIFIREMPFIAICEDQRHYLQQPYLQNVTAHPTGNIDYARVRISKA